MKRWDEVIGMGDEAFQKLQFCFGYFFDDRSRSQSHGPFFLFDDHCEQ